MNRGWFSIVLVAAVPAVAGLAARLTCSKGAPDPKGVPELQAAEPAVPGGTNATQRPPPIPTQGPLAAPRSTSQVGVPAGLTARVMPADNPQTPEKIALGQRLFFEGRLSADGSVACASCHDPDRAFTDGVPTSVGIGGRVGQRNAPTVMNALYDPTQFWDGRAPTLEAQAAMPITNPFEMGQPSVEASVRAIAHDATYRAAFESVFRHPPNAIDMLRAIASYERTLIAYDTPFDHFVAGDANAIGEDAKRGWKLFNGRGRCNKCHALTEKTPDPTNFVDNDFHNIGIGVTRHDVAGEARKAEEAIKSGDMKAVDQAAILSNMSVLGRFLITKKEADIASFKTPDIRNVVVTAPYFHDGSQQTLWDVADHYNKGDGTHDPWLDQDIQPLALGEGDIDDLVAFMASLTTPAYAERARQELARQAAIARVSRPQRDTRRAFGPKAAQPEGGP